MMLLVTSHKVRNKAGASSCSDVVGLDCQSFCNLLFVRKEVVQMYINLDLGAAQ